MVKTAEEAIEVIRKSIEGDLPKKKSPSKPKEKKLIVKSLSDKDFKKLEGSETDLSEEEATRQENLITAYENIIDLLKEYCDLKEEYYPLIAVWIIGTYIHEEFESYPYLFLNAMRGSGKTRTLKLIAKLSKNGEVQASLTEAVLFRTKGTLGLDEFEGLTRKGGENLRELLNAAYKKGTSVKRMKQQKTPEGMEQVVESFNVFRPIVMANIFGMEEVLGDRCITIVLERSYNPKIVKKIEIYEFETIFIETKKILERCSLCSVVAPREVYVEWNKYITNNYITTYTTQNTQNYINYSKLFKRLNLMNINGRDLELTLPLVLISYAINEQSFEDVLFAVKNYINEKREDQFAESTDVSLIDFISQETKQEWKMVQSLTREFKEFIQSNDEEINPKWMGRALKRLNLLLEKKRSKGGISVILNIIKAQENIKMFK